MPAPSCKRFGRELRNELRNREDANACFATASRLIYCNEPLAFSLMDYLASGSSMAMLSVHLKNDIGGC